MLKRRLELDLPNAVEVDAMSFRALIRAGAEQGLIGEVAPWWVYRDKRNITSHTYDARKAAEVAAVLPAFARDVQALLAWRHGQLEHHVAHRAPIAVNGSLAPDNAGKALELSASQPQLAIQRDIRRQGLGEPGRCGNRITVARDQLLAVPDGTHTIIFLTDQVATDIDTLTIDIGQQDIRRRGAEQQ